MKKMLSFGIWLMLLSTLTTIIPWQAMVPSASAQTEGGTPRAGDQGATTDKSEKGSFDCYLEGKQAAKSSVSTGGSFAGGLVSGLLLGLIGTGIAVWTTGPPETPYNLIPMNDGETCKLGYVQGFQEEGKSKKRSAALTGGLIGTLALVVVVVAVASSSSDYYYYAPQHAH